MANDAIGAAHLSGAVPQYFPSFVSALLIAMEFIDLGKWVVAVEGGAHFGSSLLLLVLLFNCSAIFCQYLAICIAVATRKNLAQICCEEYSKPACLLLGFQAEISIVVSDITNILGVAHGFNLLFGMDLFKCIILSVAVAAILPVLVKSWGKPTLEVLYICISGFVLFFYVFGILIAQPEIPIMINGIFPRLNGENSYLVMALLGSNMMVHNFYTQSSMVQKQLRPLNANVNSIFHDHFFSILFIFSGVFLANFVLINSATSLFENASLVNFQDVFLLMDQMFSIHIAPVAFLLVLLFSSLTATVTWNHGGQDVMESFFGLRFSGWVSVISLKSLAIIPVIFYAQSAGAEGLYQLLIFSQVMLAILLPSSVIPLFRIAASRQIMGSFSMSWCLELLALTAFVWMFASNIFFLAELSFGSSNWIINLSSSLTHSFIALLLLGCISVGFTLYMMVTPLKSASDESNIMWSWELQKNQGVVSHGKEDDLIKLDKNELPLGESDLMSSKTSAFFNLNLGIPEMSPDSSLLYESVDDRNIETTSTSSATDMKELNSSVDLHTVEIVNNPSVGDSLNAILKRTIKNEPTEESAGVKAASDIQVDEGLVWEPDDVFVDPIPSGMREESSGSFKVKGGDPDSGTGSLSRLSGLGRAARRQFSAVLDEFWGHFFDFHGQLTQEAIANKVDILLGLDLKTCSTKSDIRGSETHKRHLTDVEREPSFATNSRNYSSPNLEWIPSKGISYDIQKGSHPFLLNRQPYRHSQSSHGGILEPGERRYSSLHLPQYSDNWDYQPATIHGYQISSCVRGLQAGRHDSSLISQDQSKNPNSPDPFFPKYRDPVTCTLGQDRLGSLSVSSYESQAITRLSRLQDESSYHDSVGSYDNIVTSEKKYHSLPDISGRTVSSKNSSFNNRNIHPGGRIGAYQLIDRMTSEPSQFSNLGYRSEPLTFDALSPSKIYMDIFSPQSSSDADAKSLWSRQPFEQLFGMAGNSHHDGLESSDRHSSGSMETSYAELETRLLKSLRVCISKLLKLEGSEWLIRENHGADEELIDRLILKERYLGETDKCSVSTTNITDSPHQFDQNLSLVQSTSGAFYASNAIVCKCGEGCVWRTGLLVSFGVWCIRRILELSLMESRPELWGKYTYVLNRLQGILELAFLKPRSPLSSCPCVETPVVYGKHQDHLTQMGILWDTCKLGGSWCTTSGMILDTIKDVELAISSRKGRMGTAAGDVAFPKGKENLASVLKRYKRRLSNKMTPGTHQESSSIKIPSISTSGL